MSEPTRDSKKRYEELMRGAGENRRAQARRALAMERRYQAEAHRRDSAKKRSEDEKLRILMERIERELDHLQSKYNVTKNPIERTNIRAEIVHLRKALNRLKSNHGRKPPESGIPVPAVPPRGPVPMQGGAEAPLDFGD